MTGTVKWFNARKGYGFIAAEDGEDYFCHQTEIRMEGFRKLIEGETVSFDKTVDSEGRNLAVNVLIHRQKQSGKKRG